MNRLANQGMWVIGFAAILWLIAPLYLRLYARGWGHSYEWVERMKRIDRWIVVAVAVVGMLMLLAGLLSG